MKNYSQCGEQKYLLEYFEGVTGRFLDVGAYDGENLSNTRALYELGWTGACVEPSPLGFNKLQNLYKDDSNIILVQKALSTSNEEMDFYEGYQKMEDGIDIGNACSTLNKENREFWEKRDLTFKTIQVMAINWGRLLDIVGTDFKFINIDIEGTSLEALRNLPLPRLSHLECICVEHDYKFQDVMQYALEIGFYGMKVTACNVIMMKDKL